MYNHQLLKILQSRYLHPKAQPVYISTRICMTFFTLNLVYRITLSALDILSIVTSWAQPWTVKEIVSHNSYFNIRVYVPLDASEPIVYTFPVEWLLSCCMQSDRMIVRIYEEKDMSCIAHQVVIALWRRCRLHYVLIEMFPLQISRYTSTVLPVLYL